MAAKQLAYENRRANLVLAPKDYFLGPVFAAAPQSGPREVTIADRHYLIGGFHPMDDSIRPPALDVRHARAIFSLLSFRDPYDDTRLIRFSFNEFCRCYARTNGGRYSRAIKKIVRDLMDSYIRVTDVKSGIAHEYRLIERIDIEKRPIRRRDSGLARSPQLEMWFHSCTLSPEFCGLLSRIAELQHLKLDVFNAIRSPLAQAIYLYIPSRAYHHTEADPFEITLTNLLNQVSATVPKHKSRRKELFTKNNNPVIGQLDGLETLNGRFRAKLAETTDGTDWKLQTWVEKIARKKSADSKSTKLVAAYLKSGRPRELLEQALSNIPTLSEYELDLLAAARVELGKNRRFFEMAKAILREPRFVSLLAEAKGDELEGRAAKKNPTARLIHRIMEAIAAPKPANPQP
ncbi:MAG: hypothetical protein P4L87_15800 [Formivibrio sp.]|nr:hypothetical protein [Formivibrio sp.]